LHPEGSSTVVFQHVIVARRQNCPCSRSLSSSRCSCSVRCSRPQRALRYSRRRPPRALAASSASRVAFSGRRRSHSAARPHSRAQYIDRCTRLSRKSVPTNSRYEGLHVRIPNGIRRFHLLVLRATYRCYKRIIRCRILRIDLILASRLFCNVWGTQSAESCLHSIS
jgi:hypothetical protein